jgi:Arc/MetJ-type ribon-helix-helix transcriptional regulator
MQMGEEEKKKGLAMVSFEVPPKLSEDLRRLLDDGYYASRSEAIRDMLRKGIDEIGRRKEEQKE